MNEGIDRLFDEARSAWRFRWIGLVAAAAVAGLGWLVVFSLPDRYEATASVFVDTQTALRPMLQGLSVEQDVNVQLNYVRQALLSGERLERIARNSGLLSAAETDPRRVAGILQGFAPRVQLEVTSAGQNQQQQGGSIYTFKYQDGDRARSLKVLDTVVGTFIEETLGGKRAGGEQSLEFIEGQLKDLQARLVTLDNRIAEFQKTNMGLVPTEGRDHFAQHQEAVDEAQRVQNELQVAIARRSELQRQLRGDAVVAATSVGTSGANGAGTTDTVTQINQMRALLDERLLKYTEKHNVVIDTRRQLAELEARRAKEIERLRSGDASAVASSGVSTNPVYQNIRMQLNQAEVDVSSLRGQLTQLTTKANELRKRLDIAPKVAAEYTDLTRDREVMATQYRALLANYEKACLGERADDAGSLRFDIVKPVDAAYEPVFPPRALWLSTTLLIALGVGGALAYLLHLFRPVVTSVRGLSDLVDLPVLGVVSAAFPRELAAKAGAERRRFIMAGSALAVAFFLVLALNWAGLRLPGSGG